MSYLSDTSYNDFLNERIGSLQDKTVRDHVKEKFDLWYQQYRAARLIERACELLAAEPRGPHMLLLRRQIDLQLMELLVKQYSFSSASFRGFLVDDALWGSIQPEWFSPFQVTRLSGWNDCEDTAVITLSDEDPLRNNGRDRGNDYMGRFIDLSRFSHLEEMRCNASGLPIVLYADYRKVKALEAIAQAVSDRYITVGLIADAGIANRGYEHLICEPNFYLWPLVFKHLDPDVFHVNVGWSTQGLPFMAFVPDTRKAVADFYDILTFTPDDHLDAHHSEPCRMTRASENFLWTHCNHFVHRNGGPVTADLKRKYPGKDIVPIIEYVKEPVFSRTRPTTGDLRLVYGGIIIQDSADTDSLYYSRFRAMVDSFARDHLHLYIYPSPYLYGFGKPKAVEELVRAQGLTNVHACEPLEDDEWVRAISEHDYGIFIFGDTRPAQYPYILPFKFVSYLRAGLPMIVPEDQTLMADLVRDNGIGVVYRYEERHAMSEILAAQDLKALKENVVRFRSSLSIEKGGQKAAEIYDRILNETVASRQASVRVDSQPVETTIRPQAPLVGETVLFLDGRAYIGEQEYAQYLEEGIERADPEMDKVYVRARYEQWAQQYRIERMRQRAEELLMDLPDKSFALYLDGGESLHAAARMLNGPAGQRLTGFKGFVIEDAFLVTQDVKMFAPYRVLPRSRGHEIGAVIFSLSGRVPEKGPGKYLASDIHEKFIDLTRFDSIREARRRLDGHNVILYPLYREIHTVAIMAKQVRKADPQLRSFSLSPRALIHEEFDVMLTEPCFYLWPLMFRVVDPDLVHLNVGWGIQALALSPFIPDSGRTVVDFYEVLSFLPDIYFAKTHSSPEQVRSAEKHFITNYDHVMHLCSEEITARLEAKYPKAASIVSVTEYLQEPTYSIQEKHDEIIRIVYGGNMLATTDPNDQHYRAFARVAPCYAKENLHLYIYNSPYVHGMGENDGLKQVIRDLGLASNIHACKPLELEEFIRVISAYDYGSMFVRPKDMDGEAYNYFMAYKFLSYLRAGLPMLIDAENRYMASLVDRYQVGIVLEEPDLDRIPEIVNNTDLMQLKRNVVKFRNVFSIEKGAAKVLDMYRQVLDQADRKHAFPAAVPVTVAPKKADPPVEFDGLIAAMAQAENRLYYRDQSPETLSSLVSLAQRHDPSVVVELGTLAGLSLRAWVAATQRARIFAIDLSFTTFESTMTSFPVDLSRVTLRERDILQTDFTSMWTAQDKVIFFVDAHDMPEAPIMHHVLTTAVPALPDGSVVVVDDLWYSPERLTAENARAFLEDRVRGEIDELQCFNAHYAPYHLGGSFMGFAEVIPLLEFVNKHGIELQFDPAGKHAFFIWKGQSLTRDDGLAGWDGGLAKYCGTVRYNPLESVPTGPGVAALMRQLADQYQQRNIKEVAERLSSLIARHPQDQGLSYGLAVCLARVGMLSEARDVLARYKQGFSHPRCRRLFDDLVNRVGPSTSSQTTKSASSPETSHLTIFAMPKAFIGHNGLIQRNAIRSWTRLQPKPEIILFGDEPGIREMAEEVEARHIPDVGRNEFGTPLVSELFRVAQGHAAHSIVAYVNADMILLQDFVEGVQKVRAGLPEFLLIGQRWDLTVLEEIDFDDPRWESTLLRQMQEHSLLHAECGLDYFVFRKGMYREIPPFAIGRTAWDNWLVMAPNKAGVPVVDGTEFITAIHQDHDYGHVTGGRQEAWTGIEAARNRAFLGVTDDSGRTSGAPWALRKDGTLMQVQPRPPRYVTAVYKDERSIWLLAEADRLMAVGRVELAACKWEEALVFLGMLLTLKEKGYSQCEDIDQHDLTERYIIACSKLAYCYMQMGCREQVVATYTRLLDNPTVSMPQSRRDRIAQIRQDVMAMKLDTGPSKHVSASIPALKACVSDPESQGECSQALLDLERMHRAMPEGTRAKHTLALRLSDLFRRAGRVNKSLTLKVEGVTVAQAVLPRAAGEGLAHRPKVSVITACRNAEQYLPECLDSILGQTMSEWELFLLDDGSTDGTRDIIDGYARRDPRIKAYCYDDSTGPYIRRNFAIEQAQTPFIVIQDADDIMCPEKLERLYAAITDDDRLGVVGSFYHMFLDEFEGIEHAERVPLATTHEQILSHYRQCGLCDFSWHGSAIIRKSLFEEIGFYDENPFASDSFWLAKVAEYACRSDTILLKNITESLTLRRMHVNSQTGILPTFDPRSRRRKFTEHRRRQLSKVIQRLDSDPNADVHTELRRSVCNDFVATHGHLFEQWESEPLTEDIVNDFVETIFTEFTEGRFIRCIVTCGTVERLAEAIPQETPCFDLIRGLAFFGTGLFEKSREYLEREHQMHGTAVARDFCRDYVIRADPQWTAADRADLIRRVLFRRGPQPSPSTASTPHLDALQDRRRQGDVKLSIVVECSDTPEQWRNCLDAFQGQSEKDFELIVLVPVGCSPVVEAVLASTGLGLLPLTYPGGTGLAYRRNAAAWYARGKHLAFLGEGFVPERDFVEKVLNAFARNDIDGLRGRIVASPGISCPIGFDLGDTPFPAACDTDEMCVFRKETFDRLGGFPETSFDRGAILLSHRIYLNGGHGSRPVWYDPGVVVHCRRARYSNSRFVMMDRFCMEQLSQSGQVSGQGEVRPFVFLRFVTSRYSCTLRSEEEELFRRYLNNGVFFLDRFPSLAVEWGRKALACRADSTQAQYLMGTALADLGKSNEAMLLLEKVVPSLEALLRPGRINRGWSEFPDYSYVQVCFEASCGLLARCYMKTGQYARAVDTYNRLLDNAHIEMTRAKRETMVRLRDRLVRSRDDASSVPPSGHAARSFHTASPEGDGPVVTIVTTCHNGERFLPECLDSIRKQGLQAWELFLLDDGSSDGTRRLIEEYARQDPRIKPFYFDRSEGPYARRNFAIRQAASEFIVIHDADDIMAQNKLELLYYAICADVRLAIVGSCYRIFLEDSQTLEYADIVALPLDHESIAEGAATWQHGISHGTAIIRKSMFERIGLYDENPFAADSFWSAKLAEYSRHYTDGRFKNLPQCLTYCRVHGASQTQRLPMWDPRSRRARYHRYCQITLGRLRDRIKSTRGTDVAAELRSCNCSDFLTGFKTHIIKWEAETPDPYVVSELLDVAQRLFNEGHYVSCISTLHSIEAIEPAMASRAQGFDLLQGAAFFAVQMKERSRGYLEREIRNHDNPVARQFVTDAFERGMSLDVPTWWREKAKPYKPVVSGIARGSEADIQVSLDRVTRACATL